MEIPEALRERVAIGKQWLADVREESPDQLIVRLKGYETSLNEALTNLTDAQWSFTPAADQWSIRQVCLHVSHSVRSVAMLTKMLAAGKDGPGEVRMGLLDEDRGGNAEDVLALLRKAFQRAEDSIRFLDGDIDTSKTNKHPYFGELNCTEWAVFNMMHVSIHIQQIERIKNTAGFPAPN